jgi:hypothetical protein
VGAAAGVWFGIANHNVDVTVPLNAVIGGAIGTIVGGALILMEKKSPQAMAAGHPLPIRSAQPQVKL